MSARIQNRGNSLIDPCKVIFKTFKFFSQAMAKSIRSKSMRKARAILHAQVFKPVEDARTARLSAKLYAIPISQNVPMTCTSTETGDVMMVDSSSYKAKTKKLSLASLITQKVSRGKKNRRQVKSDLKDFNIYGLSEKEIRF